MIELFRKYHVLFLFFIAVIGFAVLAVHVASELQKKRERLIREHPEYRWKDGEMITVYKNDRAILTTPCGSCVFASTDSKNTMRIEWHKECGFGQADEVTTIPMEIGIIYRAKKESCKIKK